MKGRSESSKCFHAIDNLLPLFGVSLACSYRPFCNKVRKNINNMVTHYSQITCPLDWEFERIFDAVRYTKPVQNFNKILAATDLINRFSMLQSKTEICV